MQKTIKKIPDIDILDENLIKNLKNYKTNDKKQLYQNIQQKLLNKSAKETHKKALSINANNKNFSSKFQNNGAMTSKDGIELIEDVGMGAFSEEKRGAKKIHSKKLIELMKSYEVDRNYLKKFASVQKQRFFFIVFFIYLFISFFRNTFSNEKNGESFKNKAKIA